MAEFLIYKAHWMDALTQQEIDAQKEQAADKYTKWRNTKVALTSEQIADILRPMKQEVKDEWMIIHNEVVNMSQGDIDAKREKARVGFQAKYNRRYRKGDIIEVQPDGKWPNHSIKTPFYTLKIPGLSVETAKRYIESLYDMTDPDKPIVLKRRKWQLLIEDIPAAIKQTLKTEGVVTVTLDKVKNFIHEKLS